MITKVAAFLIIVFGIIKTIVSFVLNVFSWFKKEEQTELSQQSWYGICDNCGRKSGLHELNGKQYCAVCHAKIKAEDFAKKREGKKDDC